MFQICMCHVSACLNRVTLSLKSMSLSPSRIVCKIFGLLGWYLSRTRASCVLHRSAEQWLRWQQCPSSKFHACALVCSVLVPLPAKSRHVYLEGTLDSVSEAENWIFIGTICLSALDCKFVDAECPWKSTLREEIDGNPSTHIMPCMYNCMLHVGWIGVLFA